MKFPADQQQLRILSDNELRIAVETANACRDQAEADTTLCALYSEIERRISCYPLDVETVFTLYELLYGGDELSAPPEKQLATLSHAVANIYRNRDRATFADVHRYIAFLFMALLYVPDKKAEIEYEISHIFDTWMAAYIPGTGWPDTDSAETRRRLLHPPRLRSLPLLPPLPLRPHRPHHPINITPPIAPQHIFFIYIHW